MIEEPWVAGALNLPDGFDMMHPIAQLEVYAAKLQSPRLTALVEEIRSELIIGQLSNLALDVQRALGAPIVQLP